MLVFADTETSFSHSVVLPLIFCQNIVHSFLCHAIERLLKNAWQAELPLHQVSHKHHQILREALKKEQIIAYIVHVTAIMFDTCINLLEEVIAHLVHVHQHFAATVTFTQT